MASLYSQLCSHTLLAAALAFSANSHAVSPQYDEYYSDDIFTAIEEAKQRTHHYDYSRARRYYRSTSQSIDIPRLLNTEMADSSVKTPDEIDLSPAKADDTGKPDNDTGLANIPSTNSQLPSARITQLPGQTGNADASGSSISVTVR